MDIVDLPERNIAVVVVVVGNRYSNWCSALSSTQIQHKFCGGDGGFEVKNEQNSCFCLSPFDKRYLFAKKKFVVLESMPRIFGFL